jgi:hypothetical protein
MGWLSERHLEYLTRNAFEDDHLEYRGRCLKGKGIAFVDPHGNELAWEDSHSNEACSFILYPNNCSKITSRYLPV